MPAQLFTSGAALGDTIAIVKELEEHFHGWERWFGAAAVPNGEVHVADLMSSNPVSFQADAGNNAFGSWLQIVGSGDTPVFIGSVTYMLHTILITAVERINLTVVQVGFGASGAAALAAGIYTTFPYIPQSAAAEELPVDFRSDEQPVGTKAWLRVFVPGQNTGTFNFFFGMHEHLTEA
jgi:hypothetical protein